MRTSTKITCFRSFIGLFCVPMIVMSLLVAGCGGSDEPVDQNNDKPADAKPPTGGLISLASFTEVLLEAQDAEVEAPMKVMVDDTPPHHREIDRASQGKYVTVPDGVAKEEGGKVTFTFDIEEPGLYALWARVKWFDSCSNTFDVVVNGGTPIVYGEDGTYGTWQWRRPSGNDGVFRLGRGTHTIEFRNREDKTSLDQILLTTDLDEQSQPQGILQ